MTKSRVWVLWIVALCTAAPVCAQFRTSPGKAMEEAARGTHPANETAPKQNQQKQDQAGGVEVMGNVDKFKIQFYLEGMLSIIRRNWYARIPAAARGSRPRPFRKQHLLSGKVTVGFTIKRNGEVTGFQLVNSSGDEELDAAAEDAVRQSSPLPPLPKDFAPDELKLRFNFFYNLKKLDS